MFVQHLMNYMYIYLEYPHMYIHAKKRTLMQSKDARSC